MSLSRKIALLVSLGLMAMVAIGAQIGTVITPYVLIGAVGLISILVVKGYIKPKDYPIYIFGIALSMLWQTSMMGVHLVGADLHLEYHMSSKVIQSGIDFGYIHQYMTSIVVTVIAPLLSKILHIDLVWVFKAVFPVFLACVPFIMYYVFKKQFGEKRAYWATLFFMVVPIMSLEIVGIAKSMVAEVFFALAILVMVNDMKQLYKGIGLTTLVILTLFCHYTIGVILLCFLIACFGIRVIGRLIWKIKGKTSLAVLAIAICLPLIAGYFYFSLTSEGQIIDILTRVVKTNTTEVSKQAMQMSIVHPTVTSSGEVIQQPPVHYMTRQPTLVKMAIGLDFMTSSVGGKAFRAIQIVTQILMVLGLVRLWRKRKEYNFSPEFIACILAGFILLGCCVFLPRFSEAINMTRFYHMSLFFLAPLFVLGCEMALNKRWFLPSILCVYFIFTSGLVFEVSREEKLDAGLPYSFALSGERTGIAGIYNEDDLACVRWLIEEGNSEFAIVGDVNTRRLCQGFMERYPALYSSPALHNSWTLWHTPINKYYIFLSTWNTEHNQAVIYSDIGQRINRDLPEDIYGYFEHSTVGSIYDLPVAYQSGKAVVFIYDNPLISEDIVYIPNVDGRYVRDIMIVGEDAYYLTSPPASIVRLDKQTFEVKEEVDLPIEKAGYMVTDGEYLYVTEWLETSCLLRVDINDFNRVDILDLYSPSDAKRIVGIFSWGKYLYVSYGEYIVKVDKELWAQVDEIRCEFNGEWLGAVRMYEVENGYLYGSTWKTNASLVKINLEDFAVVAVARLSEKNGAGVILDNGYGYVVCRTIPGTVMKVDLEKMVEADKLTFIEGNVPYSGFVKYNGNIYSLCQTTLVKIDLELFKVQAYFTVASGGLQEGITVDGDTIYICR